MRSSEIWANGVDIAYDGGLVSDSEFGAELAWASIDERFLDPLLGVMR